MKKPATMQQFHDACETLDAFRDEVRATSRADAQKLADAQTVMIRIYEARKKPKK